MTAARFDRAARFDLAALSEAIDRQRSESSTTLVGLSRAVGVSQATIRRLGSADDAEADGVLALIRWLGVAPETFVIDGSVAGRPLPTGDGFVRVDMELVARADGDARGAKGRTRTTIQRLIGTADRAGVPVATLTRITSG